MGVHSAFMCLVTLTFEFDIQTRPSEGKHVFAVNLAQIRSAVPEIFDSKIKKNC